MHFVRAVDQLKRRAKLIMQCIGAVKRQATLQDGLSKTHTERGISYGIGALAPGR